ncbi:calcium-binding protein [Ruegeria sp. PrR005]|uniref:Calcium-binding protein n=1 Tax=Ruegeria sp. PrR005 TaxID=2706882 RepID=A0A6B2NJF9_9RHOB|nr:calcium-binding protein [Ruegeria sp. PrR005]NDW44312.1 calcium-binding protein [Ruegeria sp. PrR005]
MTRYTLLGYKVTYDLADNVTSVTDTSLTVTMSDGTLPNLIYQFENPANPVPDPADEPLPLIIGDVSGMLGVDLLGPELDETDSYAGQVYFAGQTTYFISFHYGPPGQPAEDWYFRLGGALLPDFPDNADPVAAWNSFESTITGAGPITGGPFAPGASIPLAPVSMIHGGETVTSMDPADNEVTTGAGNDYVTVGGGGYDEVRTGAGDDLVLIDGESGYTETYVDPGTGLDVVDMSDTRTSDSYVDIAHGNGLSAGITANINGTTNVGRIDKGAGGTTILLNPAEAILGGGMGVHGTSFADTLNVTSAANGFLQVRGLGGGDRINIGASDGTVRLDYRTSPAGIVADLATGIIQDGHGGTDTVTGFAGELRGSMHADQITGSARDERFILMAGDDTLDGGAGRDLVRYDRNRVEAVDVDLAAGTATGTWRGTTFSHTLTRIEDVNGSLEANDMLAGNGGNNQIRGRGGNDTLLGRGGDDTLVGDSGNDSIDGGSGFDSVQFWGVNRGDATITQLASGAIQVVSSLGTDTLVGIEELGFDDQAVLVNDLFPEPGTTVGGGGSDTLSGGDGGDTLTSGGGDDVVDGGGGDDSIDGGGGNDTLRGGDGADSIDGGEGSDTINGGEGDDSLSGGGSPDDLRDVIYGGSGDDWIDGGAGNDQIFGMAGNDTIAGGFGVDELQGQTGDDVITGSAFSDLVYGGDGNDFVNGGFGHDRINGGTGADKFFHVGASGHGSDWVQDYSAGEADVLLFGIASATRADFQVNFAHTANAEGERAGDDDVMEAFVIYRPTGQIMWALVDGEGQSSINLQIGADVFDLLS